MNLELDHVFCFCTSEVPEAQLAMDIGFTVLPERTHQGQGTANRCIIFEENYLEFIYLSSKEDSQKNDLKLYQRADWKNTKASPFGIALRGAIPEKYKHEFWEYKPPYAKGHSIFIHNFSIEHPEAPLLFVMPLADGEALASMKPASLSHLDKNLLKHKSGSARIKKIRVASPVALPDLFKIPAIEVEISLRPHLSIQLDGDLTAVEVSPILSLQA